MRDSPLIRDAAPADYDAINRVATAAWNQYATAFTSWEGLAAFVANVASLASECELIVALQAGAIVGVVGYVGPKRPREPIFPDGWAVIRMLSVHPAARRCGVGEALARDCIARAVRDGAATIGLHTSPVMDSALRLYRRLGFGFHSAIPERRGAPYAVYALDLCGTDPSSPRAASDG